MSTVTKIPKEKALLLDIIVTNLNAMLEEPLIGKQSKRVSIMIKAMCRHIEQSSIKDKEMSLAALAVISQLKSKYP